MLVGWYNLESFRRSGKGKSVVSSRDDDAIDYLSFPINDTLGDSTIYLTVMIISSCIKTRDGLSSSFCLVES